MSDYETHKGILSKVETSNTEEYFKKYCSDNNIVVPAIYDSYTGYAEEYLEQFVIIKGILYNVSDESLDDQGEIYHMSENSDGTFSYIVRYYNGGGGFDEALETASDGMQ